MQNRNCWTLTEDDVLIESLQELYQDSKWRTDGGSLKDGYIAQVRSKMESKLPDWEIKHSQEILSRINWLKKKYFAITEMLSEGGFEWSDNHMMIVGDKSSYKEWVKFRKEAKGLFCQPFIHYYALEELFGKNSATHNVGNAGDSLEKMKQDHGTDEHLDVGHENLNANLGVNEKTEVSSADQPGKPSDQGCQFRESGLDDMNCGRQVRARVMEEMSENSESISASIVAMELKIDGMGLKIDGLVNALKNNGEVADLQAKLVNELKKIQGLNDMEVFRAINILATKHDLLRVFFTMPEEMKRSYILNLLLYGL